MVGGKLLLTSEFGSRLRHRPTFDFNKFDMDNSSTVTDDTLWKLNMISECWIASCIKSICSFFCVILVNTIIGRNCAAKPYFVWGLIQQWLLSKLKDYLNLSNLIFKTSWSNSSQDSNYFLKEILANLETFSNSFFLPLADPLETIVS